MIESSAAVSRRRRNRALSTTIAEIGRSGDDALAMAAGVLGYYGKRWRGTKIDIAALCCAEDGGGAYIRKMRLPGDNRLRTTCDVGRWPARAAPHRPATEMRDRLPPLMKEWYLLAAYLHSH